MFNANSRYYNLETAQHETSDGRVITYVRRRILPQSSQFELLNVHTVGGGQRLDHIAAEYLGDPEQFWRICDANNAMSPQELEEVGRQLRITLPEGIPGGSRA
ncbi:MAG: LysM domain-containing protein [Planctomycetota bacterium]